MMPLKPPPRDSSSSPAQLFQSCAGDQVKIDAADCSAVRAPAILPGIRVLFLLLSGKFKGTLEADDPVEDRRSIHRILAVHAEVAVSDKLETIEGFCFF